MKKYRGVYRASPVDYDATIERARNRRIKVETGGGRRTKGGESPNAQIILDIKHLDSKILISRTGKVEIYFPSRPNLKRCLRILEQCYVPKIGKFSLECQGPTDSLDLAFEYTTKENWNGTELRCAEAKVSVYQWQDLKTGEYLFQLPDRNGRVAWPGPNLVYKGCCPVRIVTVDKDDEKGNRIVTAERLRWQMIQELRRIARERPRMRV